MSMAVPSLHGDISPVGSTILHALLILLILLIRLQEASMLLQAPAASASSTRLTPHKPGELMHPGYAWEHCISTTRTHQSMGIQQAPQESGG